MQQLSIKNQKRKITKQNKDYPFFALKIIKVYECL